jgi:hypothetical protein
VPQPGGRASPACSPPWFGGMGFRESPLDASCPLTRDRSPSPSCLVCPTHTFHEPLRFSVTSSFLFSTTLLSLSLAAALLSPPHPRPAVRRRGRAAPGEPHSLNHRGASNAPAPPRPHPPRARRRPRSAGSSCERTRQALRTNRPPPSPRPASTPRAGSRERAGAAGGVPVPQRRGGVRSRGRPRGSAPALIPPPSRTNWTRLVPPPVLIGHVSSLPPVLTGHVSSLLPD